MIIQKIYLYLTQIQIFKTNKLFINDCNISEKKQIKKIKKIKS